jgi:hypothetical protein
MDYNSMLLRLGLDPSNFVNRFNEPIKTDTGFIYEVEQKKDKLPCPFCPSNNVYIKGYSPLSIIARKRITFPTL